MEQTKGDPLLLATKLAIPPVRSDLVARPRLFQKLETCKQFPLTLLAAPAGFGKTMTLGSWARQQHQPVAWVSLDACDNDPAQFWTYVVAALDTLRPGVGTEPLSLLQSQQPPPVERVLIPLVNALGTLEQDSILILDDYHAIEAPPLHRTIAFLLDHLPPRLHLVLASRIDPPLPLPRLRARHHLLELRADELRFTFDEAAAFLNTIMGFRLNEHDVIALETRTEGWIAGLQLAALSMQGKSDITGFVSAFTGTHRYIVDYLTEEVLAQQSEPVRTFLLQTSILDRLNGSLCDGVTGQTNSQAMLEQLEQANLFLLPLDDERHWYRYHHLFAEALQFRLTQAQPDALPTLHIRTSAWFERHNLIPEAIDHAFAAHDFERAATLMEPIIYQMFNRGTHATVRRWLQSLPEEILFARPALCLLSAWAFMYIGELASCERPLEIAERAWREEGKLDRLGEVLTFHAGVGIVQGDAVRTRKHALLALALLPKEHDRDRCNCATYLGGSALMLGDVAEASRLLDEARVLCQSVHLYGMLYAMNFQAELQIVQGKLRQAAATSQDVISRLSGRASIHSSRAHSRLAHLFREWNELDLAKNHTRQAITLGEQAGQDIYMSPIYLACAQVLWSRGELQESLALLDKAEQVAQRLGRRGAIEQARAFRAQMALAKGNLAAAELWSEETGIEVSDVPTYERETNYLMLARLRIAQGRAEETLGLLESLRATDEAAGRTGNAIAVMTLQALAYWQTRNAEHAMRNLARLLVLTEPEGYVRVFVDEGPSMQALLETWLSSPTQQRGSRKTSASADYVRQLLTAFPRTEAHPVRRREEPRGGETSPSRSPIFEPLTTREQDVLELLVEGLSNAEIAERLIVTEGTVKTHIKSIYSKLGVHSRTKALARARAVGLL